MDLPGIGARLNINSIVPGTAIDCAMGIDRIFAVATIGSGVVDRVGVERVIASIAVDRLKDITAAPVNDVVAIAAPQRSRVNARDQRVIATPTEYRRRNSISEIVARLDVVPEFAAFDPVYVFDPGDRAAADGKAGLAEIGRNARWSATKTDV